MSYTVIVTRSAAASLRLADADQQERVKTFLDYLATAAEELPTRPMPIEMSEGLIWTDAGRSHAARVEVEYDPRVREMTVRRIDLLSVGP